MPRKDVLRIQTNMSQAPVWNSNQLDIGSDILFTSKPNKLYFSLWICVSATFAKMDFLDPAQFQVLQDLLKNKGFIESLRAGNKIDDGSVSASTPTGNPHESSARLASQDGISNLQPSRTSKDNRRHLKKWSESCCEPSNSLSRPK